MPPEQITTYALRLLPGQDLRREIEQAVHREGVHAGWIVTAVGSLAEYNLRFANQSDGTHRTGHFEILGLTGTLSIHGCHLHINLGDEQGRTTGGHLLEGCKVYTTAEIVIAGTDKYVFKRENDGTTPWKELQIS
jgi:uncharacterized protein